jgi:large subunit ribosomal protein L28
MVRSAKWISKTERTGSSLGSSPPTCGTLGFMAKVCEVCGRGPRFGNRISHAHNVTKRRWNLNLQNVHAVVAGAPKRIRVCTTCIKSNKVQKAA